MNPIDTGGEMPEPVSATNPFSLVSPEFLSNPFPTFNRLREEAPVHWHAEGYWSVARYEDFIAGVKNHEVLLNGKGNYGSADRGHGVFGPEVQKRRLSSRDAPSHTALRRLMARKFTPRSIGGMEAGVIRLVDGLITEIRAKAADGIALDFVRDFAYPLAVLSMNLVLGVPDEIRDRFREYTGAVDDTIVGYFLNLVRRKEQTPGDDMSSDLIAAARAGHEHLKPEEVHLMLTGLWSAGNWTTTLLFANAATSLTPAIREQLAGNLDLVPGFVEETLRMQPPVAITAKTAASDLQLRDKTIRAGDRVLFCYPAANRDPRMFKDPETFDLTRTPNPHVAFSDGIHHCLGAPLARMEAKHAFRRLVQPDLAGLRLDLAGATPRMEGPFWGYRSIPMTLDR
jgi:cytochrome P450